MPDDINGMQANLGLSGASMDSIGIPTPSPADIALRLTMESASRQQQAQQTISSAPLGAPAGFREQFQRQMSLIQAQQSLNPYAAQMMAQHQPQQQQQYLPSPLTMTPPSTGVFRPPPPPAAAAPLPPVHTPLNQFSPFSPQAPAPMFSSPHEQRIQQEDIRSNRNFAMLSQAPKAMGYSAGIMAGAATGAAVGSRFGAWGGVIGAGVGAVAAGASGVAEGMGNIGQGLMRPAIERRTMGAALQNTSRNWVVSGSDVSPLGRGLSQDASNNLAGEIQNMSSDTTFQKQTGGMFNRQDLMKITRQGGEQGLMDMAQDVPQIKQQLKQTATTIKQFMELTNDPDVTNVIRQMGRMRQLGMTQQDMTTAAQGMKTFSRAAGTSIEGLQQMGGLPGAATFQQAGLTAGEGFKYGNFAAASSRQLVASGGVSPRQLALMGGVQGMAQRDMQGQAAMGSMPMFAAANAQYGDQGWGTGRGGQQAAEGGAFGMVHGALRTMNQAVQRGGIGALASFPLKQREIADKAMSEMTPQEQMAQRFQGAMTTGQRLGLKGEEAFSAGSRLMYGDDQAQQMLIQAKSPEFWKAQRGMLKQRKKELGQETMWRAEQESPILGGVPRDAVRSMGFTGRGSWGEDVGNFFEGIGEGASTTVKAVGGIFGGIGEAWDQDMARREGRIRTRLSKSGAAATAGVKEGSMRGFMESAERGEKGDLVKGDMDISNQAVINAANLQDKGATGLGATVAEGIAWADPTGTIGDVIGPIGALVSTKLTKSQQEQKSAVKTYVETASRSLEILDEAKKVGGKDPKVIDAMNSIDDALGSKGSGMSVIEAAANALDKEVYDRGSNGEVLSEKDYEAAVIQGLQAQGLSPKEAKSKVAEMKKSGALSNITSQVVHFAKKDSRDLELWTTTQEKDHRESIRDQTSKAVDSRQESLRKSIKDVEAELDLDSTFGGSGSYSAEEEKIQKMAAKAGGKGFALKVAAAEAFTGDRDDRSLKRWDELTKGMSNEEQAKLRKEAEGMDEDMRERLIDIGQEAGKDTSKIIKFGKAQHAIGMQGAWGSAGFTESVGKYSSKLEGMLASDEGEISAQKVAGAFTDDELKKMAREGGAGGRQMAQLIKKTREGDTKAAALLEKHATEQADISEEGVEETAGVKGEGEEAQKVEAADEAMADMQKMFAGFGPASKDFAYGAKALAEAMDSDSFNKRTE